MTGARRPLVSADLAVTAQLPVLAFNWSGRSPVGSGGAGTGKVEVGDFSLTRKMDSASPKLLKLFLSGAHIRSVVVNVLDQGTEPSPRPSIRYTFTDVIISSYRHSANGVPDYLYPLDQLTLHFTKVCMVSLKVDGNPVLPATCSTLFT